MYEIHMHIYWKFFFEKHKVTATTFEAEHQRPYPKDRASSMALGGPKACGDIHKFWPIVIIETGRST